MKDEKTIRYYLASLLDELDESRENWDFNKVAALAGEIAGLMWVVGIEKWK